MGKMEMEMKKIKNLLEIEPDDYEKIEKLYTRIGEAKSLDISGRVGEVEEQLLHCKHKFDDESFLGHADSAARLHTAMHTLNAERRKIQDSKRDGIEKAEKELEEALAPFKNQITRIFQLESEKINKKKSYHIDRSARLESRATGAPRIKVLTNLPHIVEEMNRLVIAGKKIHDKLCPLQELEQIFSETMESIPKTFPETSFIMSNEQLLDFGRLFQESSPVFETKYWPTLNVEGDVQKFISTLQDIKKSFS
jgi:hypothetical protein